MLEKVRRICAEFTKTVRGICKLHAHQNFIFWHRILQDNPNDNDEDCACVRCQLLKYLNINKPMTILWSTYDRCFYNVFGVVFMFFRVVLVFAQIGYLVFGGANLSFLTFSISM